MSSHLDGKHGVFCRYGTLLQNSNSYAKVASYPFDQFCPQPSRCVNQIEEVCRTIEKTINQTVQNTLNTLEKDCELICEAVTETLISDR